MGPLHIWIIFEPQVYGDVLARLFSGLGIVDVVADPSKDVDVIVFPAVGACQPCLDFLPVPVPEAKLIAVSPLGDCGLVRLPGHSQWHRVQPFGLRDLCDEVVAGRGRPSRLPAST